MDGDVLPSAGAPQRGSLTRKFLSGRGLLSPRVDRLHRGCPKSCRALQVSVICQVRLAIAAHPEWTYTASCCIPQDRVVDLNRILLRCRGELGRNKLLGHRTGNTYHAFVLETCSILGEQVIAGIVVMLNLVPKVGDCRPPSSVTSGVV